MIKGWSKYTVVLLCPILLYSVHDVFPHRGRTIPLTQELYCIVAQRRDAAYSDRVVVSTCWLATQRGTKQRTTVLLL